MQVQDASPPTQAGALASPVDASWRFLLQIMKTAEELEKIAEDKKNRSAEANRALAQISVAANADSYFFHKYHVLPIKSFSA